MQNSIQMGSDSISNASVPPLSKDSAKKKRTNRLAKLKQCKLDVRREQWLSQVKNKEFKVDSNGRVDLPPSPMRLIDRQNRSLDSLETRPRREENEGPSIHNLESLMNSPIVSSLGHNNSRKGLSVGSSSRSRSSSSSCSISSGCCSGSGSEEEEEDDGCLDDWEAVADALNADSNQLNPVAGTSAEPENRDGSAEHEQSDQNFKVGPLKTESREMDPSSRVNCRAWRPDDAFRPQSLPNLSKQLSMPTKSDWQCGRGAITWAWQGIMSQPTSCPICYEDLDVTDSSFLPCQCGFRLCLFCHKRILEADGRCPGCRKNYDSINGDVGFNGGATPFRRARSCSMSSRS